MYLLYQKVVKEKKIVDMYDKLKFKTSDVGGLTLIDKISVLCAILYVHITFLFQIIIY